MSKKYTRSSSHGVGKRIFLFILLSLMPLYLFAEGNKVPAIGPVRVEFIIFGLVLLGVALFHKQTFRVALIGLVVLLVFKLIFDSGFSITLHLFGDNPFTEQLLHKSLRQGEWGILLNLLGLLLGFSLLSKIFEEQAYLVFFPGSFLTTGRDHLSF